MQHSDTPRYRRLGCAFDEGQHDNVRLSEKAAACSPTVAVPGRMDDTVCADGRCGVFSRRVAQAQDPKVQSAAAVFRAARVQFLLADNILQRREVPLCVYLAAHHAAFRPRNDAELLAYRQKGGRIFAALRFVDGVCGIFKLRHIYAQYVNKKRCFCSAFYCKAAKMMV